MSGLLTNEFLRNLHAENMKGKTKTVLQHEM